MKHRSFDTSVQRSFALQVVELEKWCPTYPLHTRQTPGRQGESLTSFWIWKRPLVDLLSLVSSLASAPRSWLPTLQRGYLSPKILSRVEKYVQEEFLMAPPTDQGAVPVHSWLGYKDHLHQALSSPEHYIFLLWGRIDRRVSVCSGEGEKKCVKESLNFHFSYWDVNK